MLKNTAGQTVSGQLINASTGADFSGTVTVYVTGDGGTQNVGTVAAGVCTSSGKGLFTYAPSQAETNYSYVDYTFTGTGAISSTTHIYTIAGDAFTRLGAPAGASLSADIAAVKAVNDAVKAKTDNLPAVPASTTNITSASGVSLTGSYDFAKGTVSMTESYAVQGATMTPVQALYQTVQHLGESGISGTTKTVKKRNGSTTAKTFTLDSATTPTSITEQT